MASHLTTNQAIIFCECPRKYYLRHIKGASPSYDQAHVLDMAKARAFLALFKNERRFLSEVGDQSELRECYARCLDMAIATSISQSAPHIMGADPKEMEAHIERELEVFLLGRIERAKRHMGTFGITGEELAISVTYPPEDVGRRVVDFKHRISGRISLIHAEPDFARPIQISTAMPPMKGICKGEEMAAKMNALLLEELVGRPVVASSIHYLKISETRSIAIGESNKEEVKSFVSQVTGKCDFEKSSGACAFCEVRGECGQ